jgi:acyl-[acyl-carrier-protein]-phospholipid O-acyltransferase / long-chain-fatty-acid--[acyl-carrier-protein] ligase
VFRRSHLPLILELPLVLLTWMLYRVKVQGAERVPETGGLLVLPNHVSYADSFALQLAIPRRMRFVVDRRWTRHWLLKWLFELSGTILIDPHKPRAWVEQVRECLGRGEAVCLFPEGSVSKTGQLMAMRRGFSLVTRDMDCRVLPVAHDGLWGSLFSFSGNKLLTKSPRLMPTPVVVCIGEPLKPEEVTPVSLRRHLLDLGVEAFKSRPALQRHLGVEMARALAKRPLAAQIVDRTVERKEIRSFALLAAAAAFSRHLRATVPEKRVGIVLPPGIGAFIANLAVVFAGKVPVNLNFTAGRSSLESSIERAGVKTVISAHVLRARLPNVPWPPQTLDLKSELQALGKMRVLPWALAALVLPNQCFPWLLRLPKTGADDEAALIFTSGSSGPPKGVILSHRNVLANCWQISSLSILPESGKILACLPLFHSFGFTVTLWYPLLRGCAIVTVPSPLETRKMVEAVAEEEATILVGAPTFLRPMLKRARTAELRSIELVVCGAERLPDDLHDGFLSEFHLSIMQGYGLTETSPVSSVNQHNPPSDPDTGEQQVAKKLRSVGRLLPGMSARIVHPETGQFLTETESGLLWLRGANVFSGYLADPERSQRALHDGWFVTGDIARFDEDGFLFVEGRLSRFSKIGGEMVPHGTVEEAILELLGAHEDEDPNIVVVGLPDPTKGECLALVTSRDVSAEVVRAGLSARGLAALWIPRHVVRVTEIPKLGTGKIDLSACTKLAEFSVADRNAM